MSKQVDKLKKERYKQARLEGNSIASSLKQGGYAESTAYHKVGQLAVVKSCEQELMNEVRASDITVEWVVKRLTKELVAPDAKASDRIRVSELLGKYLNMFKDNNLQQVVVDISGTLDKLKQPKPVDISCTMLD